MKPSDKWGLKKAKKIHAIFTLLFFHGFLQLVGPVINHLLGSMAPGLEALPVQRLMGLEFPVLFDTFLLVEFSGDVAEVLGLTLLELFLAGETGAVLEVFNVGAKAFVLSQVRLPRNLVVNE